MMYCLLGSSEVRNFLLFTVVASLRCHMIILWKFLSQRKKSPILDKGKVKLNVLDLRIFVNGYVHGGRIQ